MNNWFLLSFLLRYWKMLVVFVLLVIGSHYDQITYFTGPIFYLLMLAIGCGVGALLVRHMTFRHTIEKYVHETNKRSQFVEEWEKLTPAERVKLAIFVFCTLFLGAAWIAASIAK